MTDLRDHETPESETGNTGQIVGAPETAMNGRRAYETSEVKAGDTGQIAGAEETAMDDMRGTQPPEEETGSTNRKIIGAVAVALMVGAIGAYTIATGMWNTPPKQVLASLVPPSTSLPPSVAPTGHTVVPQLPPVENAPAEITPQAVAAPPVKAARTHVVAHALAVRPSESFVEPAAPAPIPPAEIVPVQPAPIDTTIVPPVTTPSPAAPTQDVPAQPAPSAPVQPATQP
jgi:hypothetical protein